VPDWTEYHSCESSVTVLLPPGWFWLKKTIVGEAGRVLHPVRERDQYRLVSAAWYGYDDAARLRVGQTMTPHSECPTSMRLETQAGARGVVAFRELPDLVERRGLSSP
jgi:hypothetical protein